MKTPLPPLRVLKTSLSLPPDDTFAFWRGLRDAGLLDDVIQEFHQELLDTMRGLQQRAQDPPLQLGGEQLAAGTGLGVSSGSCHDSDLLQSETK